VRRLAAAGVPVGVLVAPIIPFVNDRDMEGVLEQVRDAGAIEAGYVLLRLPHEVAPLFKQWLQTHYQLRAEHVMSVVRQMRGGKDYVSEFGERQRGTGTFAELIERRFQKACARLGLNVRERFDLDTTQFRKPGRGGQMTLF
jgi:DNA repair photolyase